MKRIAVEEHVMREGLDQIEERLKDMDEAGIDVQVLSFATGRDDPDMPEALSKARRSNNFLSEIVGEWPARFAAFATIPLQDPDAAAEELERAVKKLGFKGALIYCGQGGGYLDEHKYWGIFEMAEKLDVPIYIHPWYILPDMRAPYLTYPVLSHAMWGFGAATGLHAMRMICSGIFDKYPGLKIILGHMGEGIPFWLWRIDNHWIKDRKEGVPGAEWLANSKLKRKPGEYFNSNFYISTSGMFWQPALQIAYSALGAEKILFAVDYPHESSKEAVQLINTAPICDSDKEKICHLNAEQLLKL